MGKFTRSLVLFIFYFDSIDKILFFFIQANHVGMSYVF